MSSVTRIWERIYLGSLKDAELLARSNPEHIATVISLCQEPIVHRATKITYIRIPIWDTRPISGQKFEDIMYAVGLGVRRGNVLVHCLAGKSRSPIVVAAWLDRCGYAGIENALSQIAELRDLGPSETLLASVKEAMAREP